MSDSLGSSVDSNLSQPMAPFPEDPFATYPPTDYKYKGDMKKRSAIINRILTTDIHLQQLHAENRAGLDVPDATDITISKRKWEAACLRFRKHLRDLYRRQLEADLVSPGLWDLECGEW